MRHTTSKTGKGSEFMSHSTIYRICLLSLVLLTIVGGIFYYMNYVKDEMTVTEGTLVQHWEREAQKAAESLAAAKESYPVYGEA